MQDKYLSLSVEEGPNAKPTMKVSMSAEENSNTNEHIVNPRILPIDFYHSWRKSPIVNCKVPWTWR